MSVVEDVEAAARVVLEPQRLQPRVVGCVTGDDVDGRLAGSVCNWEAIGPVGGSYK